MIIEERGGREGIELSYAIITSIYAFLLAGFDTHPGINRPPQLPLVRIIDPRNAEEITSTTLRINFEVQFRRWDNQDYIPNQPRDIHQNLSDWRFLIKYQPEGDSNWYFIQDLDRGFPTKLGQRPENEEYYIQTTNYVRDISRIPNGM
ncbi:MAG: hypothetical protein N2657_06620 [bacterium]|nr:hypothetical protein [bacterium]